VTRAGSDVESVQAVNRVEMAIDGGEPYLAFDAHRGDPRSFSGIGLPF
jgi:hypothetical protein